MSHVYDLMARCFANEGVRDCFALLGDANMNFATRLAETGCRLIYVRHEHCAAAAAMAYARKTGDVGVATVTCGPGLTQLMTALPAAVRAKTPMVILAGEAPISKAWYNQGIDQAPFVQAAGAEYMPAHDPARIPTIIRDAFLRARKESRPIVVGVPFDLQELSAQDQPLPEPSKSLLPRQAPQPPNPTEIAKAKELVERSKRVVVVGGLGVVASGAQKDCIALAQRLDAPTATTLPARGVFEDDPCHLGIAGGFSTDLAREHLQKADLVVAIGTSLTSHMADAGKLFPNAKVLHVDINPVTVSQGRVAAHEQVRGDARLCVKALSAVLGQRPVECRTEALEERIQREPADKWKAPEPLNGLDPRDVVADLDRSIPKDWQVVNSSGHCSYFFAQMRGRPNESFLTIREFGAIGNGTSYAMGVSVACPDQPVVLFDGDGSLLMHAQEIETMVRHGLPVLMVVLNDGAYGSEIHKLRAEGLSDAGAVFGQTDLAAVACGFGAKGMRVKDLAQLPGIIQEFQNSPKPTLIDVLVSDQVVSPVIRRSHAGHFA